MNYSWTYAHLNDATELVDISMRDQYQMDPIYNINSNVLAHNLVLAIVNQYYTGRTDLIAVARDADNKLLGYTWAHSGDTSIWSAEPVVNIRMAHVDPDLSVRRRITLIKDMFTLWERYAQITSCPIIASGSVRQEQTAFLKLHERAGYIIRGAIAYKRVDLTSKPSTLF